MPKLTRVLLVAVLLVPACSAPPPDEDPVAGTIDGAALAICELTDEPPGTTASLGDEHAFHGTTGLVSVWATWAYDDTGAAPRWEATSVRVMRGGVVTDACDAEVTEVDGTWILEIDCSAGAPLHVEIERCPSSGS